MRYPDKEMVNFEKIIAVSEYRMKNCNVKVNDNKTSKAIYYRSKVVIWRPSVKIRILVSKALSPNLKRVPTPLYF